MASDDKPSLRSLYAKPFPLDCTEGQIAGLFAKIAQVSKVRMRTSKDTNKFKGSVFVEFATVQAAEAVLAARPKGLGGAKLQLMWRKQYEAMEVGGGGGGGSASKRVKPDAEATMQLTQERIRNQRLQEELRKVTLKADQADRADRSVGLKTVVKDAELSRLRAEVDQLKMTMASKVQEKAADFAKRSQEHSIVVLRLKDQVTALKKEAVEAKQVAAAEVAEARAEAKAAEERAAAAEAEAKAAAAAGKVGEGAGAGGGDDSD